MEIDNDYEQYGKTALLKTDELDAEIKNIYNKIKVINQNLTYLPLGTIISCGVVSSDACLKRLDGQSISQSGTYKTFCDWLKAKLAEDATSVPACNIIAYATAMETYGQCGRFVINDTARTVRSGSYFCPPNSIKFPTITSFIASNNGGGLIGVAELDTLKTHFHEIETTAGTYDSGGSYPLIKPFYPSGTWNKITSFDGTKYTGDSETKPKNVRYPYYMVVAQGVKSSSEFDIDNYSQDLLAKADINATNIDVDDWSSKLKTKSYELVYDRESDLYSLNWGFTAGIMSNVTIYKNLTQYKYLKIYYSCFDASINDTGGNANMIELSLANHFSDGWCVTMSMIPYCYNNGTRSEVFRCFFKYNLNTKCLQPLLYFNTTLQVDNYYYIYKIEGVK